MKNHSSDSEKGSMLRRGTWVRGHFIALNEVKSLSSGHVTRIGWEKLLCWEESPRRVDLGNADKRECIQGRQRLETIYHTNTQEDIHECPIGL